jgi:hypothetical protein
VRYSVLYLKNLHSLRQVFTFGHELGVCGLARASSTG